MKYNLSEIMAHAWRILRKHAVRLSEALHRAWASAKAFPLNQARIEARKAAEGLTEDVNTWAGWKEKGFEVIHGMKALFTVDLIWASRGDGASYKASFFASSQVQPVAE